MPLLKRSAPARVVNVSSAGQQRIDFDDVMLERRYDGWRAYAQSKLARIMFTVDLADELRGGVTVSALHPASLMDTKMVRESFGRPRSTVRQGADATLRLVVDPDLDGVTARYFDGRREARPDPQAADPDARARLRQLTAELTGLA